MFVERFLRFVPKNNLKKALGFFNKGEYRKACKEFESYIDHSGDPDAGKDQELIRMYMVESYTEYSKKLDSDGDTARAVRQLEKAIELQPKYADVHYGLGKLYEKNGNRVNARESLKRALGINPNYFRARVMLSRSYWLDGKHDRSREELITSLSSSPAFFIEQVQELVGLVNNDPLNEDIMDLFRRLLEERPSSSQVSKQLALESIQNGDYEFALAELKKSLSLHPDYPDLHNMLGIAYANTGMTDDAIMEFETALKINPEYLKARLNLALSLYEKGARDESRKNLDMVLKLDPENELAKNLMNELSPVGSER
jgi:Tfp pilus assembly protein PilF